MLDRKTRTENLDHTDSLKANELVAPMLYRKTRTENYGSHWFFEGERISSTDARTQREHENLDHIGPLQTSKLVGSNVRPQNENSPDQVYDSKTHLDRVRHSCLRRRKCLINSNRPWSSSIGCHKNRQQLHDGHRSTHRFPIQ